MKRYELNTVFQPRFLGTHWKVVQVEENGYVCECVEYPDVHHTYSFIHNYELCDAH